MQILLTGATGFLGRTITAALLEQGHRVRALVRSENRELAKLGVEQRIGLATEFESVCAAADGCEAIVHAAGCSDPQCDADHGYTGVVAGDDFSLRVSRAADGNDAVGGLLSFAASLSARTHPA